MFQSLRQNSLFYILEKGDNLNLKVGQVVNVSNPQPKYNQFQTTMFDLLSDTLEYKSKRKTKEE